MAYRERAGATSGIMPTPLNDEYLFQETLGALSNARKPTTDEIKALKAKGFIFFL